jgi:DNA transformation protein
MESKMESNPIVDGADSGGPRDASGELARMKNLGPVSAARLRSVGITDPEDLRQIGSVEAYLRLKRAYPFETSLVTLYALEGALTDTHWYALPEQTKAELRARVARRR